MAGAEPGGERATVAAEPATAASPARSVYLGRGRNAVITLVDLPPTTLVGGTGVLLCPPFGWDDVCSYRSRRAWAQALAAANHPVARIDLPGTGDSGGSPRDPERLEAWTAAVSDAAAWLRTETGCERVAAIGIGLGGIVACRAVALGGPIDDLILWAVPARGRALIRELRAFAALEADSFPGYLEEADSFPGYVEGTELEPAPPPPDGSLEVGGFVMTPETVASLEQLDLTALDVPEAPRRGVLLLERDGLAPDRRLREHFERAGAMVTVAAAEGYGPMMDNPRVARPPRKVFARTISWLGEGPRALDGVRARGGLSAATVVARETLELDGAGARGAEAATDAGAMAGGTGAIRETPVSFEARSGRLFGVLAEPIGGPRAGVCVVLLNAGAIRRIGPNRMWVELARHWAARGVPSVRIDLRALGDSDGDERRYLSNAEYYVPELTEQALATLDELKARGLPNRFVLAGLCSGAYWSFRGALADERVVGAFMINLWSFFWSESLNAERDLRRLRTPVRRRESVADILAAVLEGRLLRAALHALLGRARRGQRREREIDRALDLLRDREIQILLQLSGGEPLYDDLVRTGRIDRLERWPNLVLDRIPSGDHTFRALRLQRHVHESLDRVLDRVLEATAGVPAHGTPLAHGAPAAAQPGTGRAT